MEVMKPTVVKLTRHSQGDLGAKDWGKEGDGLYASARHLWATSIVQSRKFERLEDVGAIRKTLHKHSTINLAFPRASVLLIGYCVEMYLKGGLTKLLIGCADDVFRSTLRTYSHSLDKIACDLFDDMTETQISDLKSLSKFVGNDARYPVEANNNEEYVDRYNSRARSIYNGTAFNRYCDLAKDIRARISRTDNDSSSPCSTSHWTVDGDGYLCYRYGGHLPSRITYRRGTTTNDQGAITRAEIIEVLGIAEAFLPGPVDSYAMYADVKAKRGRRTLVKIVLQ
jgi:hypothetical protein